MEKKIKKVKTWGEGNRGELRIWNVVVRVRIKEKRKNMGVSGIWERCES